MTKAAGSRQDQTASGAQGKKEKKTLSEHRTGFVGSSLSFLPVVIVLEEGSPRKTGLAKDPIFII